MSAMSEETPTNPQDPLHYAPRRTNPRPELRLSTVSSAAGETAFDRPSRPELVRRPPSPSSLSAELEDAVFESLRRQMDPQVIPEPPGMEGRLWRRAWLGVGAAVAVAAIAATLFVTLAPREEAGAGAAASLAATAAPPPAPDDATKPALDQFRALMAASGDGDQAANREQSDRLLKQFMQWRQKSGVGDQAH